MLTSMRLLRTHNRFDSLERNSQKGQTLVEFALCVILFLTLLFGIIEFGRGALDLEYHCAGYACWGAVCGYLRSYQRHCH